MQITLMIPDLFSLPAAAIPARDEPAWRALVRWLTRGESATTVAGMEAALLALADIARDPARDVPVGAIAWVGEGGAASDGGYWLRADPVHLRADRDRVLLFAPAQLEIQPEEAQQLSGELNRFFAADGWRFEAPHPARWYLRTNEDPQIRSYDLAEVVARSIAEFMPSGRGAARLAARLTEIQMLLHSAAVNDRRSTQGRLPINSVWMWGAGVLPVVERLPWTAVYSDEPFARGLATLAGVRAACLPASASEWLEGFMRATPPGKTKHAPHVLMVCDALRAPRERGDSVAFLRTLNDVCTDWIAPIYYAVRRGQFTQATLASNDGRVLHLNRAATRRFWRRGGQYRDFAQ